MPAVKVPVKNFYLQGVPFSVFHSPSFLFFLCFNVANGEFFRTLLLSLRNSLLFDEIRNRITFFPAVFHALKNHLFLSE